MQGRLQAAEPSGRAGWHLPSFAAWLRPWPLAYASLGAAWAAIFILHLLTQAPPPADHYIPVAQSPEDPANPAPATLTAGFLPDRAILLTRNNHPDSPWP